MPRQQTIRSMQTLPHTATRLKSRQPSLHKRTNKPSKRQHPLRRLMPPYRLPPLDLLRAACLLPLLLPLMGCASEVQAPVVVTQTQLVPETIDPSLLALPTKPGVPKSSDARGIGTYIVNITGYADRCQADIVAITQDRANFLADNQGATK